MRWIKRSVALAALLALLAVPADKVFSGGPVTSTFTVVNFNINQQLILELYNTIEQTSGHEITEYPADMPANVLTLTVRNNGPNPEKFCLKILINEKTGPTNAVIQGGPITTKNIIQPGETVTLNALDFETGMNFTGQFDDAWAEDTVDEIADDPSALDKILKLRFEVCAIWVDCGSGTPQTPASQACTTLSLVHGGAGGTSSVAVLIFPHNQVLQNPLVGFVAAPAFKAGVPANEIEYKLEIMEGNSNAAPWHVKNLGNSPNYQWLPSDPKFKQKTEYFWRLISSHKGRPFGGPADRGWNIVKRFEIRGGAQGQASQVTYDINKLLAFIATNAPADIKAALAVMTYQGLDPSAANSPEFIDALIRGKARVTGWTFEKK